MNLITSIRPFWAHKPHALAWVGLFRYVGSGYADPGPNVSYGKIPGYLVDKIFML